MATLEATVNFDTLGFAQSITVFASGLPPRSTVTVRINGTKFIAVRADSSGNISQTLLLPANLQLGTIFFLQSAAWNIPAGINLGDSFTAIANVNEPLAQVIMLVQVS